MSDYSDYWEELEKMEEERDALEYAEAMAYQQGRADAIEEFVKTKGKVLIWLIERNCAGYGTTNGELLEYIYEIADQMKGETDGKHNC